MKPISANQGHWLTQMLINCSLEKCEHYDILNDEVGRIYREKDGAGAWLLVGAWLEHGHEGVKNYLIRDGKLQELTIKT